MYHHINGAINLLKRKAHLLIENENNNRAERLMNVLTRFTMGKRLNLVRRDSYEMRVQMSALRYNKKEVWVSSPSKRPTGRSPGACMKKFQRRQHGLAESNARKRLFFMEKKEMRSQTYYRQNSGQNSDISEKCRMLMERLQVDVATRDKIVRETVGRFENKVYKAERRYRLTASHFGPIVKTYNPETCRTQVERCLTLNPFQNEATRYGIEKEPVAIKLLEKKIDCEVMPSGLWVDLDHGFLGATPDGLISGDALVEVKCLHKYSKLNVRTMHEVLQANKIAYLEITDDGEIHLKKNHKYYFQVQGQLNISGRSKCYFGIYVNDEIPIFCIQIKRDEDFWKTEMLPKLINCYKDHMAPMIVEQFMRNEK